MPQRFQRTCRYAGCRALTREASGYCEDHVGHAGDAERARNRMRKHFDPIWNDLYASARWTHFRKVMLRQNPICQRLRGTERCSNVAHLVHHILSPRTRPDLFIDPNNCVCLCGSACHPNTEGTPEWVAGRDFVRTEFDLSYLGNGEAQR